MANDVLGRILRGRPLNRRSLMKTMAAAGLGMAAMPLLSRGAEAADEALVYTWSGYNDPKLYPAYVTKHGSPTFSFLGDTQEALNKLRETCPAYKSERAVDLQLAIRLLTQPRLYDEAIRLAAPPGQRPATQSAVTPDPHP